MKVKTLKLKSTLKKTTCIKFIFTTEQINFNLKLKKRNARNCDIHHLISIFFLKLPTMFDHMRHFTNYLSSKVSLPY